MEKNKSNMENKDIFHNQSLKLVFSLILAFNLAIALAMAENITAKAGDLVVDGDVNATKFYGDGSGLTGAIDGTKIANNTDAKLNSLNVTKSMAVDTSLFYVNSVNKRVGIHTSSPSAAFEVVQDGSASTVYVTGYRLTAGNGAFYYARSARGTEAAPTALNLGDAAGTYAAAAYNGSDFQILGRVLFHIDSNTSGLYGSTIQFNNRNGAGAEVTPMVINENGSVGIGTTSPAQALTVVGQINVTSLAAASATDLCINGGVLSSCSSSKAFKENIQNITINADLWENYLKLNPVIYNFKGDSKERIGLIAEDVQPLLPKVVYDIKVPVYGEVNETSIIMDGEGNYIEVNSTRQAIIDEKTYPSVDYDDVAAANILFIQDLERRLEIVETESCTKDPTFSWC